jgi:hypothetical protein
MTMGRSSRRTLVGANVQQASSQCESRRNQSRARDGSAFGTGRGERCDERNEGDGGLAEELIAAATGAIGRHGGVRPLAAGVRETAGSDPLRECVLAGHRSLPNGPDG